MKKILIAAISIPLSIAGCGRGDFSAPIMNGYEYDDAGGLEKAIIYRGTERSREIVIDARVDNFKVDGNKLIVARRPREIYRANPANNNAFDSRLLPTCEFWIIDVKTHQVQQTTESSGLHCN